MASKRDASPGLVQNPFIKKRNLEWNLDIPGAGARDVTEGNSSRSDDDDDDDDDDGNEGDFLKDSASSSKCNKESGGADNRNVPATSSSSATSAAAASSVETGLVPVSEIDHASYFSILLARATLSPFPRGTARLPLSRYRALYEQSWGNPRGAHFVVHQHDHPVAGLHYDLRLQINETSSASWAVMYGLPGSPNGARQNRNATETRVHCLWNHLIETGSHTTGSLLIWDTGTYSVLPPDRRADSSQSPSPSPPSPHPSPQETLAHAFRARKIRLRLHGARLPDPYVINLRLPRGGDASSSTVPHSSNPASRRRCQRGREREQDQEEEQEEEVRRTNAYAGATNSIGSVYQRRWFLSLDRAGSGFVRRGGRGRSGGRGVWECELGRGRGQRDGDGDGDGDQDRMAYPFYVRGLEAERSVVTGRLGEEVLRDEGVVGIVSYLRDPTPIYF
ncbi:DNA polymerase ligase-domain-containing protein [Biscogniauxia sp. FL1348]|nr:DNA polymerase ligase-domain-containing protein [Biscogniauxia sp. FL1348]